MPLKRTGGELVHYDGKEEWMTKHTPGPWILGHQLIDPDLRLSVHQKDGWSIALCDMRVRPTEENEANARLIAVAPEMFGVLEAVEWVWRAGPGVKNAHLECPMWGCMYPTHKPGCKLDGALKKARGE